MVKLSTVFIKSNVLTNISDKSNSKELKIKRIYYLYIQAYIFNYINHTNIKLYDRGNSLRKKRNAIT